MNMNMHNDMLVEANPDVFATLRRQERATAGAAVVYLCLIYY